MARLFEPVTFRGVTCRNRAFVSPMCQYSSEDGMPDDWHLVHLGALAVGGAGLVFTEATAVVPEGRISPWDTGIWNDAQQEAWQRIARFVRAQGAVPGLQLAHAGRKASVGSPWRGGGLPVTEPGLGWPTVAPSAVPFRADFPVPHALTVAELAALPQAFAQAARRARAAGFEALELHAAHGYLLHQFLSPLSNRRSDAYGGPFEHRVRFPLAVCEAVRAAWPDDLPLFVRISATDWAEGGWDLEQSVEFARLLAARGVDLVDCSSGGLVPDAVVPLAPGYQVPFARAVRERAGVASGAVGLITTPRQAEEILADGAADVVLLAREMLRDPHWPLRAAHELGAEIAWPPQYERGRWPRPTAPTPQPPGAR